MSKPSFLQMVKNFAAEAKEYVQQGAPNVTKSQYAERLQECDACPHLEREHMRCGLCGCHVENKAKWETASCPDSRWRKIIVGENGKKVNLDGRKNTDSETVDKTQPTDTDD